jgi:two-component system, LytTR family, sensor kinase
MPRFGMSRAYVLCQLAGWSSYVLLNLGVGIALGQTKELSVFKTLVAIASSIALGLIASHGLRAVLLARGWLSLSWWRLFLRMFGASIAVGVVMAAVMMRVNRWVFTDLPPVTPTMMAVFAINLSILMLLWQLLYVGAHYVRRYEGARTAQLRTEVAAQAAQLQLMRAQLNPHFLFNALNSIRALIKENPERAQDAVTQLSGLLRHSLSSERTDTVPLRVEMDAVRDYLRLEQIRFEERLEMAIDLDERTLDLPVPSMLVQTLVENAIKHGISLLPAGGTLTVTSRHEGNLLRIAVVNSGQLQAGSGGTRVGLANARARLTLLFGEGASLDLGNRDPESVAAEVRIPLRRAA